MKSEMTATESTMRRRIDRLACGELPDGERQELLSWLETDMTRWRDCALALLEAQMWEETLERVQGSGFRVQEEGDRSQGSGVKGQEQWASHAQRAHSPSWLMPLVAVAASIAAFACGMWWQGMHASSERPAIVEGTQKRPNKDAESPRVGPLLASVPVKGGPLGKVEAMLQFAVLPPEAAKGKAASSVSEHVRKQWERRGYELKEERRYLPARLPDGKPVMVPVDEVKMKYVGRRVS